MTKRRKAKTEAVVSSVVRKAKSGPHAVAKDSSGQFPGDIKIGLEEIVRGERVWQEKVYPQPGSVVVVSRLVRITKGWHANKARFRKASNQRKKKS